jgi:apolipoprotein N-acyltransferase
MTLPAPLLAALLGAASVAAFAPLELFVLPLFTLALLLRLWQRSTAPRRAAWLGFCFGIGFFLTGVSWVYVSLHDVGGMAAPLAAVATLLFCAYLALFPALAGYLFRRLAGVDFWQNAVLASGLWTLTEWLRGWAFTGFPWLALGYSQTPPSPLAGFAPVLGVYGVGFLVALLAALLAFGAPHWRRASGAAAVVMLLFITSTGFLLRGMDWTQAVGAPLSVSLLQGNVPQSLKWDPQRLPLSMDTYVRLAQAHPADLTVLPETAIPLFFDQIPRDILQALGGQGALLLGAAAHHRDGGYVNGAMALSPVASSPVPVPAPAVESLVTPTFSVQSYAKRHLVPFGEYAPPGFAWFFQLVRIPMSDFSAGPAQQAPLTIAGQQIAPNICYEDLFGEELLASLPQSTLLINLSNTAWFGDSLAQPQHLQIARLRALETGRMMLRATNTGITAAIAPDGRVFGQLPPFTRGALHVVAQGYAGRTPFSRWGNALVLVLAIGALLPALLRAYRQRRSG